MRADVPPMSGWIPAFKCGATVAVGWTLLYWQGSVVLGLVPPCLLNVLTGIRCPFCGMTRDFVAIAHWASPSQNPFSAGIALCTMMAPGMAFARATGLVPVPIHSLRRTAIIFAVVAFVLNNLWVYR